MISLVEDFKPSVCMHVSFPQSVMHVPVILSFMINLSYNTYQMKNTNREATCAVTFSIPQ